MALLQGLMDTDGYCVKHNGSCEFYTTNDTFADDVRQSIESLGFKVRMKNKPAMLYGIDCGTVYICRFTPSRFVFRLPRKKMLQRLQGRLERRFRYVVSVEFAPGQKVRDLHLASGDQLLLASSHYVVTGSATSPRHVLA